MFPIFGEVEIREVPHTYSTCSWDLSSPQCSYPLPQSKHIPLTNYPQVVFILLR